MMSPKKRQLCLLIIFLAFSVVVFGLLTWRVVDLKYTQKEALSQASWNARNAVVPEKPRRGMILDCKGRILAASLKISNAFAEPRRLQEYPDQVQVAAATLQDILGVPGPEICGMIDESRNPGYARIKSDISRAECEALKEAHLPAIGIETDWVRSYPAGNLTGHVLGFVGADDKGLSGLELRYNSLLQGNPGKQVFVVDVLRRPIGFEADEGVHAENGKNLILTVDSVIQRFVHEALKKKMEEYEAESAVGIVMDPWTGAILAMVSLPDYNPDKFSTSSQDQMRNRVLTDPFEPGSIFKPIVATIALETGAIRDDDVFYCENGFWSAYHGIHDFEHHRYGNLTVREIIMHSSNIGMAKIGLKMTQQQLYDGLKMFGFSQRTGIDLPGEDPGLVWSVPRWSKLSITRIPFGHEVLVTPLQICRAYCILANGGYLIKPHIVRAIVDNQGEILEDKESSAGMGYILKTEVANWMVRKALTSVVNEGTGDKAKLDNIQVWGKTGTANIAVNGHYDWKNYVSSFVGGAPAQKPEVVVLVSIRKPNRSLGKGYSGGRVAAPVAHDILENTLRYMGVIEEEPIEEPQVAVW